MIDAGAITWASNHASGGTGIRMLRHSQADTLPSSLHLAFTSPGGAKLTIVGDRPGKAAIFGETAARFYKI